MQNFWHIWLLFLDIFFCKHFYFITGFCQNKISIFANLQKSLQILKSRAQELSNNVSFFIFGHQTWDLEPTRTRVCYLCPPPMLNSDQNKNIENFVQNIDNPRFFHPVYIYIYIQERLRTYVIVWSTPTARITKYIKINYTIIVNI